MLQTNLFVRQRSKFSFSLKSMFIFPFRFSFCFSNALFLPRNVLCSKKSSLFSPSAVSSFSFSSLFSYYSPFMRNNTSFRYSTAMIAENIIRKKEVFSKKYKYNNKSEFDIATEKGGYNKVSFLRLWSYILLGNLCAYIVLFIIWKIYENKSKSQINIGIFQQILSSNLLSHLGPLFAPIFIQNNIHRKHLKILEQKLLLDSELTASLTSIESISRRKEAVKAIIKEEKEKRMKRKILEEEEAKEVAMKGNEDVQIEKKNEYKEQICHKTLKFLDYQKLKQNLTLFLSNFVSFFLSQSKNAQKDFREKEDLGVIIDNILEDIHKNNYEEGNYFFNFLEPLLMCFVSTSTEKVKKSESHFLTEMRCVLDFLNNTSVEDREVPYDYLLCLVNSNEQFWLKEPRNREIQDLILFKFLQNEQNSLKVYANEALNFLSEDKQEKKIKVNFGKSGGNRKVNRSEEESKMSFCEISNILKEAESQKSVLQFLYESGDYSSFDSIWYLSGNLLSGESHDIKRDSLRVINKHVKNKIYQELKKLKVTCLGQENTLDKDISKKYFLTIPTTKDRKSQNIYIKIKLRELETLVESFFLYTFLKTNYKIERYNFYSLKRIMSTCMRSVRGGLILEAFFQLHELLIDSNPYYNQTNFMLCSSALMTMANSFVLASVIYTHKYVLAPFLMIRFVREFISESCRIC